MSCCAGHQEGDNMKGMNYGCPMHPKVVADKPGKCPECGMELVREEAGDKKEDGMGDMKGHEHHDHASMMASPEAAKDFLRRFFVVTVLLVPLAVLSGPAVKYLGVPDFAGRALIEFGIATVIFYFGLVFFRHAKMEIAMKQYGMMTLVSLGVGAGYLFSVVSTFVGAIEVEFYLEMATLIWVLLFGHFLEAKSSTAAGDALEEVAKLLPKEAHRFKNYESGIRNKGNAVGEVEDVDIALLKEGDVVLVKPGEKVPADGVIVKGSGNFNESHITGESKPIEKKVDSEVVAGAINIDGSVEVRLSRVGESSTIGQIRNLIASAKQTKPSAQKLADRASRWLTFTALGVSLTTLVVWSVVVGQPLVFAATLAITVLVIACPHALGLAIPTVSTIATKLAVKNGVFMKDMGKIEVVKRVDYVVFDKTGTLTKGEFGVTSILSTKSEIRNPKQIRNSNVRNIKLNKAELRILKIAASLEQHSSHVVGLAIVKKAEDERVKLWEATAVKNLAGMGMEGMIRGKKYWVGSKRLMEKRGVWKGAALESMEALSVDGETPVFVADGKQILGVLGMSDEVKEESMEAVKELHGLGVKVAMLTGDTKQAARPVAKKLGIDSVFAEVLPEDKYKYVKKLQDEGNMVVMAGDGVNDAPALTQANAGVAIGAGTDVAVEAGDMVLTQSNPQDIVRLIILARKVYRKMVENLIWALGYNVIAIPAAAGLFIPLGFRLTPAVGALLMSASSVLVVANAMTLRKAELKV